MRATLPPAASAKGSSTPNCGLTAVRPNKSPASAGRFCSEKTPSVRKQATGAENCPKTRLSSSAGEKRMIAIAAARGKRLSVTTAPVTAASVACNREKTASAAG